MTKPATPIRWIAGVLAALAVLYTPLLLLFLLLFLFFVPGFFFWIGRITIAAGSDNYNNRIFWSAGAVWECLMIAAYFVSCSDRPIEYLVKFSPILILPVASLLLSLVVLALLSRERSAPVQACERVVAE